MPAIGTTAVMNALLPAPLESSGQSCEQSTPQQQQILPNLKGVTEKLHQPRISENVEPFISTRASGSKIQTTSSGDNNGDVIGEYVLGETIGKGTFGKVKVGLHLLTGEKVAIKILEKKRIVQAADVERVAREIKILKRNKHPNVIQLYEVIDSPECLFLIMEHVDGGEMFEYIVSHHRIREHEASFLFRQIIDGLAYLHSNDVTHRDLKPENLLLQSNRHHHRRQQSHHEQLSSLVVKIVDFGLSNMHDGGRLLHTACGSPCYAAPEMIQGKLYHGPIADMWSLGVVLFAMVCGFLPFEDSNTNLLYKKILSANYKMPSFLSANAQDLIRHILEIDPEKRYTVDKIRQHPWLAGVQAPNLLGLNVNGSTTSDEAKTRHGLVLDQLEALGLPRSDVQTSLSNKAFNRFTSSYYLLNGKLERLMQSCTLTGSTTARSSTIVSERVRQDSTSHSSETKHQDRQQGTTAQAEKSDGRTISATSESKKILESPRTSSRQESTFGSRNRPESSRRRSIQLSSPHPPPSSHPSYPLRPLPPSTTASHREDCVVVQRSTPMRTGRNLVMITNATSEVPSGTEYLPLAPNPPRDHRGSGPIVARKPQSNARVTITNGMVALRPRAQPVVAPRRDFVTSSTSNARQNSMENAPHAAPPRHDIRVADAVIDTSSQRAITPANGSLLLRPQGRAYPSPQAAYGQRPHQPLVAATSSATSTVLAATLSSKADDTRAPQWLS